MKPFGNSLPCDGMDHPFKKLVVYHLPEVTAASSDLINADTIVCIDENGENEAAQELLKKILQSVNVTAFSQLLVESGKPIRLSQMISIEGQNLISFGPGLRQLGLSAKIPLYQIGKIGAFRILLAEDLSTLSSSNAKKKMLWEALKQMFDADDR